MISKPDKMSLKLSRVLCFPAAAVLLFSFMTLAIAVGSNRSREEFSVKPYSDFHEVLHPLQHEALPQKDYARFRANATKLVKRGQAIVRVGVPRGTAANNLAQFRKELKKFDAALKKFSQAARKGTDGEVEASFSSVHDSFEMLAGMLPRS
jgi:hypothetical protein